MDMEAVNAFNGEMLSMMDMAPPISRAKMMSVTKAGIKAIKLYKHVVQIVEKFIKRCKPDLKVAGLYVVDSIIRQSRHQFGTDKDVFAPRFLKNFSVTFQNLYECPEDDKTKILRVLNLWQKNDVFGMDTIQPLLDMATAPVHPVFENGTAVAVSSTTMMSEPQVTPSASTAVTLPTLQNTVAQPSLMTHVAPPTTQSSLAPPTLQNPVTLAAVAQLLQGTQGLEHLLQSLHQSGGAGLSQSNAPPTEQKTSLAKSLLDRFDYDDDPEPVEEKPEPAPAAPLTINLPLELQQALQAHLLSQLANQSQVQEQMEHQSLPVMMPNQIPDNTVQGFDVCSVLPIIQQSQESAEKMNHTVEDHNRGHRRSRSRSPRRSSSSRSRRSRSGSRSTRSRHQRTRSRSRERRARSEERRERDKERERRQKGLASIRKEHLSVCSTTLWIGQLDKKTQQQDIMSLMEEFGQVESINMIPPRGCAYIVMVHRQDAYTALNKLSKGAVKVNQKSIKIAWALNKGIKSEFKKFWDVERGVTYIPWDRVKREDIQSYRDGGMLDAETLKPDWNVALVNQALPVTGGPEGGQGNGASLLSVSQSPIVQPISSGNLPLGPPPTINLPPPAMMTGTPPLAFPPLGFNSVQMPPGFHPVGPGTPVNTSPVPITGNPAEKQITPEVPKAPTDLTGGPPLSPPAGLLGPRPQLSHLPVGPRPPFMPPFSNEMRHPNMPLSNMMPPRIPNPPYGERPAVRFRMPRMATPVNNFPPPREGFSPRGPPRVGFPPRGSPREGLPPRGPTREGLPPRGPPREGLPPRGPPREGLPPRGPPREGLPPRGPPRGPRPDQWEEEPDWNNQRDHGAERGPERFEPPFHRGGWVRGVHRGRGHFGN